MAEGGCCGTVAMATGVIGGRTGSDTLPFPFPLPFPIPEPTLDRLQIDLQRLTEPVKHNVTTTYHFASMPMPPGDHCTGVHIAGHYFYDKLKKRPRSQLLRYMWHTEACDYQIGGGYAMSDSMLELDPRPQPVPPSPAMLPSHGTTMVFSVIITWTQRMRTMTKDDSSISLANRTPISLKRCATCKSQDVKRGN